MDEQSDLSKFGEGDSSQTDQHECGICGRSFDSPVGQGNHTSSHAESEIKQAVISELQRVAQKIGDSPSGPEMDQHGKVSASTCKRYFDSWNESLRAAGLETNQKGTASRQDVIDAITRLNQKLGRPPKRREMDEKGAVSSSPCKRLFGSFKKAVQEAGYDPMYQRDISRQDLIAELQRLDEETDSPVTQDLMMSEGKFSFRPYRDKFGSWPEALRAAELDVHFRDDIPREELIDELQAFAKELGHTPSYTEMENGGPFSPDAYDKFGKWNEAVQAAGLEINGRQDIPQSDLEEELKRLADEFGRSPERREMDELGEFSSGSYKQTFGKWNNALETVGLEIPNETNISESKLVSSLKAFAKELGHTPVTDEMQEKGPYSVGTYAKAFDSWHEALNQADLEDQVIRYPDDLDHMIRSWYEYEIAVILLDEDVEYGYESLPIEYDDDRIYTPDFVTDQHVIEVKGYAYDADDEEYEYPDEIDKAEVAIEQLTDKQYIVIQESGPKIPANEYIEWENRDELRDLL